MAMSSSTIGGTSVRGSDLSSMTHDMAARASGTISSAAETTKETLYKAGYGMRDTMLSVYSTLAMYMREYPTLVQIFLRFRFPGFRFY